jgi:hypothetical protein
VNPDNGQFIPKPADLVKLMQGSTADSAMQAWTKLDFAVRCVGVYASVSFDDPIINVVINDMGGWVKFGTKSVDEWPFVSNEFVKRYRAYKTQNALPRSSPDHLPGRIEMDRGSQGFIFDPFDVVRIGQNGSNGAMTLEHREAKQLQQLTDQR